MLNEITAREFRGWMAYYAIEPWGNPEAPEDKTLRTAPEIEAMFRGMAEAARNR